MDKVAQYLYVIGPTRNGPIKVGIAKDPRSRLTNLQTGSDRTLHLYWSYPCPHGDIYEKIIHRILNTHRLSGEWFDVPVEAALGALWIASNADQEPTTDGELSQWICHIGLCRIIGHPFGKPKTDVG